MSRRPARCFGFRQLRREELDFLQGFGLRRQLGGPRRECSSCAARTPGCRRSAGGSGCQGRSAASRRGCARRGRRATDVPVCGELTARQSGAISPPARSGPWRLAQYCPVEASPRFRQCWASSTVTSRRHRFPRAPTGVFTGARIATALSFIPPCWGQRNCFDRLYIYRHPIIRTTESRGSVRPGSHSDARRFRWSRPVPELTRFR